MKYRKRPVVIEAQQFLENESIPDGVFMNRGGVYVINTLEGQLTVSEGDFIITGIKGKKYPCKPDIFWATYEPVDEDNHI